MLALIIFSILLLFIFLAVGGYARFNSLKRSKALEAKKVLTEPDGQQFCKLLDEQISKQQPDLTSEGTSTEIDDAHKVTLSSDGVLAAGSHIAPRLSTVSEEMLRTAETGSVSFGDDEAQSAHHSENRSELLSNTKEWDIVLALTILAPNGHVFLGQDIAAALNFVNMEAGEMQIFHCYNSGQQRQILFSVANLLAPGTLTVMELSTLQTQGLVVFMRLPNPANSLIVFDAMLAAADTIAKRLNGQLRDEHREMLTEGTLEKMRSRILNFNLTQQFDNNQFKHDYPN